MVISSSARSKIYIAKIPQSDSKFMFIYVKDCHGRDCMVVGFTSTYAQSLFL
jgi:hypothetical protein